jgi:hypothetical protein
MAPPPTSQVLIPSATIAKALGGLSHSHVKMASSLSRRLAAFALPGSVEPPISQLRGIRELVRLVAALIAPRSEVQNCSGV